MLFGLVGIVCDVLIAAILASVAEILKTGFTASGNMTKASLFVGGFVLFLRFSLRRVAFLSEDFRYRLKRMLSAVNNATLPTLIGVLGSLETVVCGLGHHLWLSGIACRERTAILRSQVNNELLAPATNHVGADVGEA